ncbi:hypothetical protein MMC25_005016 [Agyrium rufum]|nr:hypothetical protein [Agyrium rufum]
MSTTFDPIEAAFERAAREFKVDLKDDTLYNELIRTTDIDKVYDATDKLQAKQAAEGHLRHLAKIQPYLTFINDYSNAVGVFVQLKPSVLALIWGPIVLLLQWASVLKTSFDAIVNVIAEIGHALPEFKQSTLIFQQNAQIKDVLLLFFRDILDFYVTAFKFFRLPRWRYLFEALWPKHRDKIKIVATNIERHALLMRKEVQLEHIQQEHKARLRAFDHYESTAQAQQLQEYYSIKTDISPATYDDTLYRLRSKMCEGTGKWLLKDQTFIKWLDPTDKSIRFLWLQGIPGAGKTFLSCNIIDKAKKTPGHTLFAFLSYNHTSTTPALSILHSLIFQVVAKDPNLQISLCESGREDLTSSDNVAVELLSLLLAGAGTVYIVIDGLDEIDMLERSQLVRHLLKLSQECQEVQIVLCSRPEADMKAIIGDRAVTITVNERNAGSIQAFVTRKTKEVFDERQMPPVDRVKIEGWLAPLASKASGMFLYAKVVLDGLEFLNDFSEIESELRVLPESLEAAYDRILTRVNNLRPQNDRETARKLLGWVSCSPTPMTQQELQQALAIKKDNEEGKMQVLAGLKLDKLCGPIIEIVDGHVQLVHFTAKEYLLSSNIDGHIDAQQALLSLGLTCMRYLCQQHHNPNLDPGEIKANILSGRYVLHGYADSMWLELSKQIIALSSVGTLPSDLTDSLERFLSNRANTEYSGDQDLKEVHEIKLMKRDYPDLHNFLTKVTNLRRLCSLSPFKIQKGGEYQPLSSDR